MIYHLASFFVHLIKKAPKANNASLMESLYDDMMGGDYENDKGFFSHNSMTQVSK